MSVSIYTTVTLALVILPSVTVLLPTAGLVFGQLLPRS